MAGASLIAAGVASGAVGDLNYRGCVSGSMASGPPACTLTADATANGMDSGLDRAESVTVSRDGEWLYAVVGNVDDSIARFKRIGGGALSYRGCISGNSDTPCVEVPNAASDGTGSGLDDVRSLVISRDGSFAYAVSAEADAIVRFKRNERNGRLTYGGCIGGNTDSPCTDLPDAAPAGDDSGLDDPKSLVVSGRWLYAAGALDASVARFKRDPGTGRLDFRNCITGETESGSAGSGACTEIDADQSEGDDSGLDDPRGLAITRRGRALLGVSSDDDALFVFDRDREKGHLTFDGCFTGESETVTANSACDGFNAEADGANSGLDDLRSMAITRGDSPSIYIISRFDAAVTHIPVDGGTPSCLSADEDAAGDPGDPCTAIGTPQSGGADTGLEHAESAVASRDGKSLYVSAAQDAAVTIFNRNRNTGALTHDGCITGQGQSGPPCAEIAATTMTGNNSGLAFPQFMTLTPDDRSLYLAAGEDASVAHFRRER